MKTLAFNLCLLCSLLMLNGCTALGLVADSHLDKKHDNSLDPATSLAKQPTPGLFTELGMMLDGAVLGGVKKALQTKPAQPKQRCRKNGNLTECWQDEEID